MFVLAQDKTIVDLSSASFTRMERVDNIYRVITQVGYFNDIKKPDIIVLGEYETEADADCALNRIWNGLFMKREGVVMPPFQVEEENL